MSEVSLKKLTKVYGGTTVVDHIDLTVPDGTLTSILGPSGCGKTTTLRMIAGFETPESGDVLFDGVSVSKVPVNQRGIGMVFQSYALFPHMTVGQNVSYGLEQQKVKGEELRQRVEEALKMVHMEEYINRKPRQLSGGQQQRVALARALVIRPRVLLLDECLSALDKKLRVEMQGELRRILEECGVTTFFVTHDQEEAMTLSDAIVVMNQGVIEQTGTPAEVYEHPRNRFVANFWEKQTSSGAKIFYLWSVRQIRTQPMLCARNELPYPQMGQACAVLWRVWSTRAARQPAASAGESKQYWRRHAPNTDRLLGNEVTKSFLAGHLMRRSHWRTELWQEKF